MALLHYQFKLSEGLRKLIKGGKQSESDFREILSVLALGGDDDTEGAGTTPDQDACDVREGWPFRSPTVKLDVAMELNSSASRL